MKYQMDCAAGERLVVEGSTIKIITKRSENIIPISSIKEFRMKEPSKFTAGNIFINTGKSPDTHVGLFGAAIGIGGEIRLVFTKDYLITARAIQKYISEYHEPVSQPTQVESAADELRKYKSLLDDGIISQAEFDAKKKQLLGL